MEASIGMQWRIDNSEYRTEVLVVGSLGLEFEGLGYAGLVYGFYWDWGCKVDKG
jgi:hypothetical protein